MISQAIILAAGKGSRLSKYTNNVPKALLPIKYGQTIIERMLQQLTNNGINEIVVVLGYQNDNALNIINELSESFRDANIHIAINQDYAHTGTLRSLLIGKEELPNYNEDFLVVEGDVICDDEIIHIITKQTGNTFTGDSSRVLDTESMKYNSNESNIIQNVSKELPIDHAAGEAIGIVRFDAKTWSRFLRQSMVVDSKNNDAFYEEVIDKGNLEFNVLDICPYQWTEVDFPSEYKKARQIFSEEEKIIINKSLFEQTTHSPSIFSLVKDWDIEIKDFCFLANPYLLNNIFIEELSLELKQLFGTYPPLQAQLTKFVSDFHDSKIAPENIIVGNGASELIDIINHWSEGTIVSIPTFSEYIDSANVLQTYQLNEKNDFSLDINDFIGFCKKQTPNKYSNVVIINPNNPVGRTLKRTEIGKVIRELTEFSIIVDESFLDFSNPNESVLDLVPHSKNLVVVKSFGKTLGMPGVRLGAIYSNVDFISKIRAKVPIWNVNCIASYILELMSHDKFKNRLRISIERVIKDTNMLYDALSNIPYLKVFIPTGNFVVAKILNGMSSTELRDILLQDKIFIRDCTNKIGLSSKYIRVASRTNRENMDIARHIEMILADFDTK